MKRKAVLNFLFVLAAVGTGLYFAREPWLVAREQAKRSEAARKEMREAERKQEDLTRQKQQYESPLGRETLAREHGYHREGEVTLPAPPK